MLRLAQVSKGIRHCIFQQVQLPIWNVTIRADSKRPVCPSFMNPVRYTGLLFGSTCFVSVLRRVRFEILRETLHVGLRK